MVGCPISRALLAREVEKDCDIASCHDRHHSISFASGAHVDLDILSESGEEFVTRISCGSTNPSSAELSKSRGKGTASAVPNSYLKSLAPVGRNCPAPKRRARSLQVNPQASAPEN